MSIEKRKAAAEKRAERDEELCSLQQLHIARKQGEERRTKKSRKRKEKEKGRKRSKME